MLVIEVKSQPSSFEKDFDLVANVFEKELTPYLQRFVTSQYPESKNSVEKQLRDQAMQDAYFQKANRFRTETRKELFKENPTADKKKIFEVFELGYRLEFPGLDYKFFESVKKSLNI